MWPLGAVPGLEGVDAAAEVEALFDPVEVAVTLDEGLADVAGAVGE